MGETLLTIDAEQAGKKLNVVRRYHMEILLIVCFAAIGFLYKAREHDNQANRKEIKELNDKMNGYIDQDRKTMIQQTFETNETLKEIKQILQSK